MRKFIYGGMFIGAYGGSYLAGLWGAGTFSVSGIFFNTLFAIGGILIGYKIGKYFGK